MFLENFNFFQPGQISSVGVPSILNIISIYWASFYPASNGVFKINSAIIQPTDHISRAAEYSSQPSKTYYN